MPDRGRRRAQHRKRKARAAERRAQITARYEERNSAAREELEPLRVGERPAVVTAGAAISGLLAASILVAYLAGAEVNGERPRVLQVIFPAALMAVMSFGLWRTRYWAVLGFQAALALIVVAAALGLLTAHNVAQVAGTLALIAIAGTLFYFMIRAMARIQMPERGPRE
jgi:hypothetical protein